jgi:citrate synthase
LISLIKIDQLMKPVHIASDNHEDSSMNDTAPTLRSGLENVAVAQTRLSDVDGVAGTLTLCGEDLGDFVARHSFESAAATFWATAADDRPTAPDVLARALGQARVTAYELIPWLGVASEKLNVSEAVRLGLAAVPGANERSHIALTASVPVLLANIVRIKSGRESIPPRPAAGHVEDFLYMLHGEVPDSKSVAALSTYLVAAMDHGMNASTFTARVIASTRADLTSAVVGAFGALSGPLHGGAPEPVLQMLEEIGRPENAKAWIDRRIASGERIMGFGHRVYRVRDPRADVLSAALSRLNPAGCRLELAKAVESAALRALASHKPGRSLETNVEFYTAMLLEALGIPGSAFTTVFAMARVVGWIAHSMEQRRDGRLMRPSSIYVGSRPARTVSERCPVAG